ncbi:MAG TPA: GTPase, partial [bacterium]|nr:GTPase [bacterium]
GKSTLLNALSRSSVHVEDKLFATLSPTTRKVYLGRDRQILMTDTVGFIRNLPPQLVAAFRGTLEEIGEADLLLHVLDISHPHFWDHKDVVEKTLKELGYDSLPRWLVLNKTDLKPQAEQSTPLKGIFLSALTGEGLGCLKENIAGHFHA